MYSLAAHAVPYPPLSFSASHAALIAHCHQGKTAHLHEPALRLLQSLAVSSLLCSSPPALPQWPLQLMVELMVKLLVQAASSGSNSANASQSFMICKPVARVAKMSMQV